MPATGKDKDAPVAEVVRDDDGGYSLIATVGGVELTLATVNPSQVAEAAAAQGKPVPESESEAASEPEK